MDSGHSFAAAVNHHGPSAHPNQFDDDWMNDLVSFNPFHDTSSYFISQYELAHLADGESEIPDELDSNTKDPSIIPWHHFGAKENGDFQTTSKKPYSEANTLSVDPQLLDLSIVSTKDDSTGSVMSHIANTVGAESSYDSLPIIGEFSQFSLTGTSGYDTGKTSEVQEAPVQPYTFPLSNDSRQWGDQDVNINTSNNCNMSLFRAPAVDDTPREVTYADNVSHPSENRKRSKTRAGRASTACCQRMKKCDEQELCGLCKKDGYGCDYPTPPRPRKVKQQMKRAPKFQRALISLSAKLKFEALFRTNPYPSKDDISALANGNNLPSKVVKNWFSNIRSRRNPDAPLGISPYEFSREDLSGCVDVSCLREEEFQPNDDHPSPTPSSISLERYLASSSEEEGASTSAIEDNIKAGYTDILKPATLKSSKPAAAYKLYSDDSASSIASVGSGLLSIHSCNSLASMDSRGSRRGRRRWKPVSSHPIETTATSSQPKNIFYCTFSGCNRFFSQQYEWVRHEESVHYPQKKWICCQTLEIPENVRQNIVMKGGAPAPWPQNFDACLKQPEDHRTFYRKDHLVQHIQQVHLGKKSLIPTDLLQLWADDACEPLAGDPILRCGFCGDDLPSWTARRHHVAAHFKKGLDMSAWWPSRKRIPFVPDSASGRFTCPLCNKEYSDCESAALEHHHCAAWSCRFLVNFESTFTGTESARCKLCSAQIKANPFSLDGQWHAMRLHCEYHRLRDCDQDIYSNFEDFTAHMCTHRQVELEQAKEELFDDWCTRLRWSTNKQQ